MAEERADELATPTEGSAASSRHDRETEQLKARISELEAALVARDSVGDPVAEEQSPEIPVFIYPPEEGMPLTEVDILASLDTSEDTGRPDAEKAKQEVAVEDDAPLSDDDIATLFERADQLVAPKNSSLTARDIEGLLNSGDEETSPAFTPTSATMMSETEIAALMRAAEIEQEKAVEFTSQPATESFEPRKAAPAKPAQAKPTSPRPEHRPVLGAVDTELADRIPLELAVAALALPTEMTSGKLVCQVAEPFDHVALAELSRSCGLLIETVPSDVDAVVSGLRDLYRLQDVTRRNKRLSACSGQVISLGEWILGLVGRVA